GDLAFGVVPDFRARGFVVGLRVHRIFVLIRVVGIGNFAREFFGDGVIAARILGFDGSGADDDFGAKGFQQIDFFAGLLIVDGEDDFVATRDGDEGEAHAGIAGGAFDDGAAGFQNATALGVVNHPFADAVFHRAAGIHVIGLDVNFGMEAFGKAIEPDE